MDRIEIHKEVIQHFGIIPQLHKAIEEISELINELDKYDKSIMAIISELADVCNITEQLLLITGKVKELYKITTNELENEQDFKMMRTDLKYLHQED